MITWPSNTDDTISDIIDAIGRQVTFYVYSSYPCPASGCYLDPVTGESTNSFCTTCSGDYWIKVYSGVDVQAHVTWKYADYNNWQTGGYVFHGDGIIKVMLENDTLDLLDNTAYIGVDDKQVNIEKITLRGVPSPNRVIIDFKEKEKDDG